KRLHTSREFGSVYNTEANDVHLLRGLRNKFAQRASSSTKNIKPIKKSSDSSTSLILKKTSERQSETYVLIIFLQILEQYSIVSYTSLQQPENDTPSVLKTERSPNPVEKPLIKVTVIPKTDQIQTAKLLRRRRYVPKRVQSTTSNHENSIQTKNVYLIVAGRRREKIYEIKTTGSAKLSTDHDSYIKDDEIPIKELSNFKHLIQLPSSGGTRAAKTVYVATNQTNHRKKVESRFLGSSVYLKMLLVSFDKYVLRYGATINDKQVLSDVAQLTRENLKLLTNSDYIEDKNCNNFIRNYRWTIRTRAYKLTMTRVMKTLPSQKKYPGKILLLSYNFSFCRVLIKYVKIAFSYSKESQGTQVNLNVQCNVAMKKGTSSSFSDKKIQCSYSFGPTNKSEQNTLKDCQSPLVIISVYPKSSPEDTVQSTNSPDSIRSSSPTRVATYTSNQVTKTEKSTKRGALEAKRRSPAASRSPSPAKKIKEESVKTQAKSTQSNKRKDTGKRKIIKQDPTPRKPPTKLASNSTQVAKNLQNLTVSNAAQSSKKNPLHALSNATQVSNKNNQMYQMSNGTQVSVRKRQAYTVTNATQYSGGIQSMASNGTQFVDHNIIDSVPEMAPIKHSRNVIASPSVRYPKRLSPIRYPRTTQVSNATQVPKSPQFFASNGTQVSENDPYIASKSNGTQVSKYEYSPFSSRLSRNQDTYTLPNASQKRTLIEAYTKQLTDQMSQKDSIPARYNSTVTINIDGDGEYYDVLFNQDKRSTDLTIRKTFKDMGSQKYDDQDQECSASLENFMYVPEIIVEKESSKPQDDSHSKSSIYNNPSDDDFSLDNHVSRLTIRDSLEIFHRRGGKHMHNSNNLKNTQTCFTAQIATTVPNATEFLAPIKHFIGDDCSITDPVERDKQIRQLLGVDKLKQSFTAPQQPRYSENSSHIPYHKNSELTEINFEFQKVCPCFKSRHTKNRASVSVQCRQPISTEKPVPHSYYSVIDTCEKCSASPRHIPLPCAPNNVSGISLKTVRRPTEGSCGKKSAIYQQLILNRNIQVFLQVDQFSKQKPIILSRKQYDKVKKTIQKTICIKKSSHEKRRCIPVKRDKNESYLETHASSEIMSLKAKSKHSKRSSCKRNKPYTKRAECTVYGKRQRHESPVLYRRYEDPVLSSKYDRPEVDDRCERPMLYGKYEKFGDFEMFDEPDELQLPRKLDKPVASGKRDKCDKREKSSKHEKCGKRSKCDKHEKREASRKRSKCATSEKRKNLVEADSHEKCQDPPVHRKRDKSSSGKRHRSPSPGKRHRSPSPGKRHRSPSPGKRHRSPSPGKREGKKCRSSTKRVKSGTSVKRDKSKTSSKCKKSGTSSKCKKSGSTSRLEKSESCHKHDKPKKIVERVKCQKSDVSIGAVRTKRPIEKVKECHKKSAKQEKFAQVEAKCSEVSCKKYREERLWPRPSKCKTANKDNEETKTDSCDKKRKQKIIENGVWTVEHTSTPVVQQRHAECFTNIDVGTGRDEVNSSTSEQVDDPDRLSEQRSPSVYEYSNDLQQESLAHRACIDSMDIEHQETEMKTFVLFNAENTANAYDDTKDTDFDRRTRKTVSSVEVRYASVAYMKQVAYSSTDVGALSNSSMTHVKSFHTIFRGHRKSATPNLGTSAYSLYSEEGYNSENKSVKPKRPFLRRLMSCLVMRSARDSELKLPTRPVLEDPPSVNSSMDSYHISTSLGAVEISSSIYDTTASFYSNHTILPLNNKIKKGFFSSVRGFLTNLKS
ncbi:hypothetical protein HW555_013076, partial [Spodoptera exigua]